LLIEQAYENIKKRAKKSAAADKAERFKTGGGSFVPVMDELDSKIISLLGNRATSLTNPFDSSAEYCAESKCCARF